MEKGHVEQYGQLGKGNKERISVNIFYEHKNVLFQDERAPLVYRRLFLEKEERYWYHYLPISIIPSNIFETKYNTNMLQVKLNHISENKRVFRSRLISEKEFYYSLHSSLSNNFLYLNQKESLYWHIDWYILRIFGRDNLQIVVLCYQRC